MSVNIEFEGKAKDGDVLTVCGEWLCAKSLPKNAIPQLPKLEKGQRAVLTVQDDGKMEWRVRKTAKEAALFGGGSSLSMMVLAFCIYKAYLWWKNQDNGGEE